MGCPFYRQQRRPCTCAPRRPYRQMPAIYEPPLSNSFYGLDTMYDPVGGMIPMKRSQSMSDQELQNMIPPADAFDRGTLFPDLLPRGAAGTYR